MWLLAPRLRVVWELNVVCALPSPQSTSTFHGASGPGSMNEPRLNEALEPSFDDWLAAAVMVGATLAIVTTSTDSDALVLALSESVTLIFTFAVDGPAGDV